VDDAARTIALRLRSRGLTLTGPRAAGVDAVVARRALVGVATAAPAPGRASGRRRARADAERYLGAGG
jgi:hypothetical protein